MRRKSFLDNALMIMAGAAIIYIIVIAGWTPEIRRPFDYSLRHVDSTRGSPNNEYGKIRDSLETVIECEESQLSDLGVSQFCWTIGFSKLRAPGTCAGSAGTGNLNRELCYLSLAGYKISNESAFYFEGNKYMITFCQWDNKKPGDSCGRYVTKEIPVRYVKPATGFLNPQTGYVLVPITHRLWLILEIAGIFVSILIGVLVLYYAIFRSLRIILRISKGRMFSAQHTRDLVVAGRVFMALAVMPLFLQLVFYCVFSKEIPAEIRPAFAQVLWENKIPFIIGFLLLLLAKAFEKGHRLQKENSSII
jgi:DUF2975 family protein